MTASTPKRALQTRIVQPDDVIPEGFRSFVPPVARASTVVFPDLATMRALVWHNDNQWRYGLHATPTSLALAQRLAEIEGGTHALLQPSGLAAIMNVYFGIVKAGDDVLIPDNVYGPNADFGNWLAKDFGITARFYDPLVGAGIADLIQPNTRLIWVEAPGSVTMEVPDVQAITAAAKARGIVTAIDNTYSAGLAFKPFEHGVDISVQALTKYQSGGSDVLMGATITANAELQAKLKLARMRCGIGVSADDCSLVLRSLPSMQVRFDAHSKSALALAQWLKARPEIVSVLHPQLPDCPGHASFMRDFTGAGGLFSVVFDERYSAEQIDRFVESLELFAIGWSWGGACSLAMPYDVASMRADWPHRGTLVRFYVGLEDEADLRADIERAMQATLG
ncbi:cystathionine beta-lyase [Burkholderia stabilis]|uniref:Cystathionine beta-lyase metC,cystathionine beta-lyase,cystathionine beta-lyase,Cys/Met metabolism PLP-dependent enzyme n=1 Tax=Burkholderia stabilis TaxID=95485 RepID=A0AAJ5T2C0_9BURK|nr:cystathionine beta-lyase [Burkholderia stabilis]VBB10315.1 Cystathionine beta-lyase metC,cystathionine beta-lyase,cystathionine beta-lyase,Cys/Met metabolism PLP-dependent enzyme [Burkholderia stabilis]HDR9588213.1 cystathionine beta-lyase [Burkholderia stabilis]HDR9652916.1 cystathionine beta-lyase [Burkholderia stabilis]HDR9658504.1 cystathionine beta-lyase [Burkholderia stabilis]HDR9682493.1 cystathionine beta-lyase [Burkholderia stabilis]